MATRNNGIHTIGGETRLDGVHERDVTYIYTHGCRELGALGVFYMRSEHDTGEGESNQYRHGTVEICLLLRRGGHRFLILIYIFSHPPKTILYYELLLFQEVLLSVEVLLSGYT